MKLDVELTEEELTLLRDLGALTDRLYDLLVKDVTRFAGDDPLEPHITAIRNVITKQAKTRLNAQIAKLAPLLPSLTKEGRAVQEAKAPS